MGIAVHSKNGIEAVDLIKNADIAMYKAKRLGGNKYQYYLSVLGA